MDKFTPFDKEEEPTPPEGYRVFGVKFREWVCATDHGTQFTIQAMDIYHAAEEAQDHQYENYPNEEVISVVLVV
jgi:hypothetical protein